MSKLLEFFLGSLLVPVFTIAFLFFFTLHEILRAGNLADCSWQASAKAWIDSNADGRINRDEPPLSDVKVHIDDVQNPFIDVNWPVVTDMDGEAQFTVNIPGCSKTVFEIYVNIPEGFRTTTESRIEITPDLLATWGKQHVYYFGFVSDR